MWDPSNNFGKTENKVKLEVFLTIIKLKKKEREIEAAAMEMAYSSASWEEIEQVGEEIANDEGI